MNAKISRPQPREALAQKILIGCALLGGVVGAAWAILEDQGIAVPRTPLAIAVMAMIAVLGWVSMVYWRHVDEAAREAHQFAWFWGGSSGALALLPLFILIDSARLEALFGPHDAGGWVTVGLLSLITLQVAGYGLAWAGWWLIRRR